MNQVILVDSEDREIGVMEKLEAHRKGLLHRAFSIFLFNSKGEMLLQKRADSKYHCGGLWSNACCSHPQPERDLQWCLKEKLYQEMRITTPLQKAFSLTYRAVLDNGLIEFEYDHIYIGHYNDTPSPNPDEVSGWRYLSMEEIADDIRKNPTLYTPWFKILFEPLCTHYTHLKTA